MSMFLRAAPLLSFIFWAAAAMAQPPATSETAGDKPKVLVGHPAPVYAAAFTPDGSILASGGFDQKVKLWNVATGKELRTFEGHQGLVLSLSVSPDGHTLVSGASDNTIKL